MTTEAPPAPTIPANPPAAAPRASMAEAAAAQAVHEGKAKAPEVQKPAAEAAKAPAADVPAKKAGLLDSIKPKAAAVQEPVIKKPEENTDTDPQMKEQSRWKQLKAAEDELNRIKPEHEASLKERETWQSEKKAWEAERKELEELRRVRDFSDVTKSKGYIKDVEEPFGTVQDKAGEIAAYAEVDLRELMKAMQEPNSLKREDAIRAVLETGKKEIGAGNIADLVTKGGELNKIFAKMEEYRQNASLQKEQHENGQKAEKLKADTEAREILKRARTEIGDMLRTRAGDAVPDEILKQALEAAAGDQPNEPMDQAYSGVAPYLVPGLIETIRGLQSELATERATKKAAEAAKPGIRPDVVRPNGKAAPYASLQEAKLAHAEGGHRF